MWGTIYHNLIWEGEMEEINQPVQQEPQYRINEQVVQQRIDALKEEQNLLLGIVGGVIGGLLGAAIWAAVTYFTEYQIGWLAVGVGFLAGFGVRLLGKGLDRRFGIAGAIIALISVFLGNVLANFGFLAKFNDMTFIDVVVKFKYDLLFELMAETFNIMDLLFYGIAIYAGYRYSFRQISQEKLLKGAVIEVKPPQ